MGKSYLLLCFLVACAMNNDQEVSSPTFVKELTKNRKRAGVLQPKKSDLLKMSAPPVYLLFIAGTDVERTSSAGELFRIIQLLHKPNSRRL